MVSAATRAPGPWDNQKCQRKSAGKSPSRHHAPLSAQGSSDSRKPIFPALPHRATLIYHIFAGRAVCFCSVWHRRPYSCPASCTQPAAPALPHGECSCPRRHRQKGLLGGIDNCIYSHFCYVVSYDFRRYSYLPSLFVSGDKIKS